MKITKWEYTVVELQADTNELEIQEKLNSFGELGWELVSCVSIRYVQHNVDSLNYTFKRKIN